MKLKDLTNEEILSHILNSDELRTRFDDAVQESEMNYVNDIIGCFNRRCARWSIGPYNHNYFECTDASEFVYCAREMVDMYGASRKTLKVIAHAEKLRGTNLFEYYADKLADCIEADLCEICRGIEDISYDIYCRKETDVLLDYIDCFAEWLFDDVIVDEDDDTMYKIVYL